MDSLQLKLGKEVTPELLKLLDQFFPDKCPAIDAPDRKVWYDAGSRHVVAVLRAAFAASSATSGPNDPILK